MKFKIMPLSLNYRFLLFTGALLSVCAGSIGAVLTRALWNNYDIVPLWGQESIVTHLLSSSFVLGALVCWTATKATRNALRSKQVLPLHWHLKSQTVIDKLPAGTLHRAFILGLIGMLIAGITLLLFRYRRLENLPSEDFTVFFAIYCVLLSGAISVMAIYRALGDNVLHRANA